MLPSLERLLVLEDTGHMAPIERHDAVTGALVELAGRIRERTGAAA
jgi:pimeloyl-ACP methyl ester carboxylesterase